MVSGVFCFVRKDSAIVRLIALMFRKYRYRIDRASPEGHRSRIEPGVFGSSPGRSNSSARSRNRSFPTRCDRKSLRPDHNRQKPLRSGPPPRSRLAEGCIRKTGACGVSRGGTRRSREGNVRSRARTGFSCNFRNSCPAACIRGTGPSASTCFPARPCSGRNARTDNR